MKPAFPIYHEDVEALSTLSDAQLGRLIRLLCDHSQGNEVDPGELTIPFAFLAQKIDRDAEKYAARCEKNRANVNKRWNNENTNAYERIRSVPTETEKETKKETENVRRIQAYFCNDRTDDMKGVLSEL